LTALHPRHQIALRQQSVISLAERLNRAGQSNLLFRQKRLDALARQLQAIGPLNVLQRGYTITLRKKDGVIIRRSAEVKPGELIVTRFADGETVSITQDTKQPRLFE
jgi:exodeoxyribonuclease VII large subunit